VSVTDWVGRVWQRPLTVYSETEESLRHATWLELFFDLVFVVAMAQLGSYLHHHLTVGGFLRFAGLFAIVWWVWLALSYYADTYDTDDTISHVLLVATMFGVIFLSQTIDGALSGGSFAFAVAVFVLRAVLTVSHLRGLYMDSEAKRFVRYWIGLEVLVTAVWGLSLLVPEPGRFGLWIASFVISTAGISAIYLGFETVETQVSHFSERLGLFTILVLGETIIVVAFGTSFVEVDARTVLVGSLGFAIAVSAWWLYFNRFDEGVVDWALRGDPENWLQTRQRGIVHIYGHYLVHGGIIAAGVGVEAVIEASHAHHALGAGGRVALCVGLAAFVLGLAVVHRTTPEPLGNRVVVARLVAVALFVALAVGGFVASPVALIVVVVALLSALVLFEATRELEGERGGTGV